MTQTVEVRIEFDREDVVVLDGHCQATGNDRTKVIRQMVKEWSALKKHEAIVICRVTGINPTDPESHRK